MKASGFTLSLSLNSRTFLCARVLLLHSCSFYYKRESPKSPSTFYSYELVHTKKQENSSFFFFLSVFFFVFYVIHSLQVLDDGLGQKKQKKREISSAEARKSLFLHDEKGRKRRKKKRKEKKEKKRRHSHLRLFATQKRIHIYFLNVDSRASGRRARVFRPPVRCARSRKGKTLRRDPFSIQRWRLKKKRIYSCVVRLGEEGES